MRTGRTVLLLKDRSKGNEVSNYRPITCLQLMWKLITGIAADEICNHLEQKGCRKNSRGTLNRLLIDKAVMKNCRRKKVGLSMVWIDYRMIWYPTRGLRNPWRCVVGDNISHLFSKSVESWQTILMSGNAEFARVNIQRGIFQGDLFYCL